MSKDTKDVMLYGQLQEGLRLSIVKSPSVLGALSYKELCMAVKHEEKRLAEIKKRQDNEHTPKYRSDRQASGSSGSRTGNGNNSQLGVKDVKRCSICNKLGHVAKFCKTCIKEKKASGSLSKNEGKAKPILQYGNKPDAAKQVSTKPTSVDVKKGQSQPSSSRVSVDPVSLLYSDSGVDMVRVCDQGSRPQYVNIEIQGVIYVRCYRHWS